MHVIVCLGAGEQPIRLSLPVGTPAPERVYCSGPSLPCVRQLPPREAASHTDTMNSAQRLEGGRSVCAG